MNDRQRIQLVKATGERLILLAGALDAVTAGTTVLGRMRDAQGGLRAQNLGGVGRTGRYDRTFAGATRPDPAFADETELTRTVETVAAHVTRLWRIVAAYPPPHLPTDADRLALGRANTKPEPGCESCARTTNTAGGPRWEPPRPSQASPTSAGGRLDPPQMLCEWCYSCIRRWGRLPSPNELERHHRGDRVPWPADVARP